MYCKMLCQFAAMLYSASRRKMWWRHPSIVRIFLGKRQTNQRQNSWKAGSPSYPHTVPYVVSFLLYILTIFFLVSLTWVLWELFFFEMLYVPLCAYLLFRTSKISNVNLCNKKCDTVVKGKLHNPNTLVMANRRVKLSKVWGAKVLSSRYTRYLWPCCV